MSIVLFGKDGQLGKALMKGKSKTIKAFDRGYVDLTNPDHIRAVFTDTKPTIIINAAAYTAVDRAETEPAIADAVNHVAVACMAEEALKYNAVLVTFSTDYVFDGMKTTPYTEDDAPHPLNVYGASKLAADIAVLASGCKHIILRTSWLYSNTSNFPAKILTAAKGKDELRVVDDQIGAPTHVDDLARTVHAMLKLPLKSGLYNCTASGAVSRAAWAEQIIADAGLPTRIINIKTVDAETAAQRPLNSQLDCKKLLTEYGIEMPAWDKKV